MNQGIPPPSWEAFEQILREYKPPEKLVFTNPPSISSPSYQSPNINIDPNGGFSSLSSHHNNQQFLQVQLATWRWHQLIFRSSTHPFRTQLRDLNAILEALEEKKRQEWERQRMEACKRLIAYIVQV
jgi:hypothetical protein